MDAVYVPNVLTKNIIENVVSYCKNSIRKRMPVRKVQGGYQWGKSGKVYPTAAQAERQGRAIIASGYKEKK